MNSDMEFGVLLPTLGHHASQEAIRQLATTAENCDFDAVWAGDHVTFPAEIPDQYPFSPTGGVTVSHLTERIGPVRSAELPCGNH
jgi:alkanesulfonate monooxygenase SsuD/methylene tetrahydromethanopterin reductase-like flavin-dependent oxidoreductase (luciferase family)